MNNCIIEVEKKCASSKFGFVLETSDILEKTYFANTGRMATCGEALCWAPCCCFFQKTNFRGGLRFLGQIPPQQSV